MFSIKKFWPVVAVGICLAAMYLLPAQAGAEPAAAAPLTIMKPVIVLQLKPGTPAWQRLDKPLLALDETLSKMAVERRGSISKRERDYPERTLVWTGADGNKWRMQVGTEQISQTEGSLRLKFTLGATKDARAPAYQEQAILTLTIPDTSNPAGDDAQLTNMDLQNALQKQQQAVQLLSNILNAMSDSQSGIIKNLK
jgi:hypothetical protein